VEECAADRNGCEVVALARGDGLEVERSLPDAGHVLNLHLSVQNRMVLCSRLGMRLVQDAWKILDRSATAVARSRQMTASSWERIHQSDALMATQAGRFNLGYVSGRSKRQPVGGACADLEAEREVS
jgi:hypothetical protein